MVDRKRQSLTLVVYDKAKNPKCFVISKFYLKLLTIGPFLLALFFLFSFLVSVSYSKFWIDKQRHDIPEKYKLVELKVLDLNEHLLALKNENQELMDRLSGESAQVKSSSYLPQIFSRAKGAKDLR